MKLFKRDDKAARYEVLHETDVFIKLFQYIWRVVKDKFQQSKDKKFNEYGATFFVGRQGSGKSVSMVNELERIRRDYPECKIMTNFGYQHEDKALTDWQMLIDERNPGKGIVFCIDEIQNEFDVYDTRNFNLEILKVVTQQRKQGIKILATSQVFTRVSKPLREQCFEVVECKTFNGRWTFNNCFDANDYNLLIDQFDVEKRLKIRKKWRRNFVQSDVLRNLYDSYAVIESMAKLVREEKKKKNVVGL